MSIDQNSATSVHSGQTATSLALGPWVRANALGLVITFVLFGLVGEGMEAAGAEHDTLAWGLPTVTAMVVGATAFARLRQRALGRRGRHPWWLALVVGVVTTAAFSSGLFPPFDFVAGILAAGAVGGALQLRDVRRQLGRPRGLILLGLGGWVLAGLAASASAILVADVILVGALGLHHWVDGVGGFVAILALVGLVGGAVGGAVEGAAIGSRLARSRVNS